MSRSWNCRQGAALVAAARSAAHRHCHPTAQGGGSALLRPPRHGAVPLCRRAVLREVQPGRPDPVRGAAGRLLLGRLELPVPHAAPARHPCLAQVRLGLVSARSPLPPVLPAVCGLSTVPLPPRVTTPQPHGRPPPPLHHARRRHTGTAGALLCLALFLAASFSDPGTVTAANVAAHRALYPCDGLLYEEKECRTCGLPRPARSKHCSACGRWARRAGVLPA